MTLTSNRGPKPSQLLACFRQSLERSRVPKPRYLTRMVSIPYELFAAPAKPWYRKVIVYSMDIDNEVLSCPAIIREGKFVLC